MRVRTNDQRSRLTSLMDDFGMHGGTFIIRKITSASELAGFEEATKESISFLNHPIVRVQVYFQKAFS